MSRKRKLDDLMEAITFAEAGETETAQRLAADVFPEAAAAPQHERILTVGGASGFSKGLIEHSVAVAARLQYGLVALSVPPGLAALAARLGVRRDRRAWASTELFRASAEARGIPFVHTVVRGEPEQAVAQVRRHFRRIAFLVVDRELAPRARFAGVDVPIFYVDR